MLFKAILWNLRGGWKRENPGSKNGMNYGMLNWEQKIKSRSLLNYLALLKHCEIKSGGKFVDSSSTTLRRWWSLFKPVVYWQVACINDPLVPKVKRAKLHITMYLLFLCIEGADGKEGEEVRRSRAKTLSSLYDYTTITEYFTIRYI